MSIIRSHNYTLTGDMGIVLSPLTDEHLPLLYRWNSDPQVLYWSEGDDVVEPYDQETVDMIYGSVSKSACLPVGAAVRPAEKAIRDCSYLTHYHFGTFCPKVIMGYLAPLYRFAHSKFPFQAGYTRVSYYYNQSERNSGANFLLLPQIQ